MDDLTTGRKIIFLYRSSVHSAGHRVGETYGAPFVACTLLLTEANFVQQKSLLSDKSNFVYDKIIFVRQKLILSDKS